MKMIIALVFMVSIISLPAYAGDHFGDYINEQVPQDYKYPLWMTIFGEYLLRILIGGMIFFSISGLPEKRLFSARGLIGVFAAVLFFLISVLYHDIYTQVLEFGLKSFAFLLGGLLLLGIIFHALRKGLQKFLNK